MKDGKLLRSGAKVAEKRYKCPKCGKYYTGYPALSRRGNRTEICPECGIKEALGAFMRQWRREG